MPALSRSDVSLGIVTPLANEADTAVKFVTEVLAQCEGFSRVRYYVVLDGCSRDGTREFLEEHARKDPRLCVIWAPENRNVVDAYVRGYREALAGGSDWILEIDGGYSHQPQDIPPFFDLMETGDYDCLFGSRFMPGGKVSESSLRRFWLSWGGTWLANLVLGTRLKDMTSGFELFTRATLESVLQRGIESQGPFFQTEIKFHCRTLRQREVPIHYKFASHQMGSSSLGDALRNLRRLFRERKKP